MDEGCSMILYWLLTDQYYTAVHALIVFFPGFCVYEGKYLLSSKSISIKNKIKVHLVAFCRALDHTSLSFSLSVSCGEE